MKNQRNLNLADIRRQLGLPKNVASLSLNGSKTMKMKNTNSENYNQQGNLTQSVNVNCNYNNSNVKKPSAPVAESYTVTLRKRNESLRNGFAIRNFNEVNEIAANTSTPVNLYEGLWYEGELCALYADTNVGKSILAVQIAEHVARKGYTVMYFDFEMTDKAFGMRCCDENGNYYKFSDNLYRIRPDHTECVYDMDESSEMNMMRKIDAEVQSYKPNVLIIDNITALFSKVENGENAVVYLNWLRELRDKHKISILFLAHTPKLDRTQPITRDSMAGSKRVISLIDSAFAIGEVSGKPNQRYIKQTKVRLDKFTYDGSNVMLCEIRRVDGLLQLVKIGTANERKLIQPERVEPAPLDYEAILALKNEGLSVREIAERLGTSKSRVQRLLTARSSNENGETSIMFGK